MRDGYILQNTRDAKNKSNLQLLPLAESALGTDGIVS